MKNKILKPFIQEVKISQIVDKDDCLIAMDVYLVQFAEFYNKKIPEIVLERTLSELFSITYFFKDHLLHLVSC